MFCVQSVQFIIIGFRHFHFFKSSILNLSSKLKMVVGDLEFMDDDRFETLMCDQ